MHSRRIRPGPGQESVWDYPRPPHVEETRKLIHVEFGGRVIAETRRAMRVLETSHPPTYYIPPQDVALDYLIPASLTSVCEWKGLASYFDLVVGERTSRNAGWVYQNPSPGYEAIKGFLAFYPQRVDACTVDGEKVRPQEGGFYGGWITSDVVGPFKGERGTEGW